MDTTAPRPLPPHLSGQPAGIEHLSREVLAEYRRDRILAAATDVFATCGYPETTVDHLAAAAHIGVGTFYALFEGKEDCFLRAYDRVIGAASTRIAAAIPVGAPWPDRTGASLEALLGWIAAEPHAARIVLVEAQTAGPAAPARYEATLERLRSLLHDGRTCSSAGRDLPASFEYATVAGVAWLLCERLVCKEAGGIEALLPDLFEIVVEPYLDRDEASAALDPPQAVPPLSMLAAERSS